ncbi:MAG: acetate--CoA ligase family protein, partial [Caulobacteraceae bacterium]|nr:acetate--CoA ligase family protein [Caulobacteraceae bacterium]
MFATPEAPDALTRLAKGGVPAFRTPESCADAAAAALRRKAPAPWRELAPPAAGATTFLDEAAAYARLAPLGVEAAPFVVASVGGEPPKGLAYPVAAKVLSAELPHKTDAGGVLLGVADEAALHVAFAEVAANVARAKPGLKLDRVLVQTMAKGLGEVLVGFRRDPDAGPIVMLAPGGVLAELAGERALRLAPVTEGEAEAMIAELPSLKALAGYRGRPRGDLPALAATVAALSQLALQPEVIEAEINPMIVRKEGEGVVAVDALVRVVEEAKG